MSDARYQHAKHIYYEASDLAPEVRAAFVAKACNGDHALRDQVMTLLDSEEESQAFLERPAVDSASLREVALSSLVDAMHPEMPERIGRYRIIRLLGEGGMGSVYEAEQDVPQRLVALKVLRTAPHMPRLLQRFQQEVEVLGQLQHPGIARIYDAGVAELEPGRSRPLRLAYFAMELIVGQPITRHAESRQLSLRARLAMLAEVCDAVQFGHQHGVVHRDLKPANILVQSEGGERTHWLQHEKPPADAMRSGMEVTGHPKVIDFGVARVTNADLALTTMATDAGQMIGTLAYMSPEQVLGNPHEVDARSDIYALGVIGFELLTGRLPYDVGEKFAPEAARIIRDEEPSRMSSISRVFRGDIETIFAKALEKEPSRRYGSAAALAADIRRFLNDEPIIARPPTLRYQLTKLTQRHKEFVAGLALVFIVLVAGVVGTGIALIHARSQESDATSARNEAQAAAKLATAESLRARESLVKAEAATAVMQRIFEFAQPDSPGGGRDMKVVDMLDHASKELLGQLQDAPEVEYIARRTLGQTYCRLGMIEVGSVHFRRSIELAEQLFGSRSIEAFDVNAEFTVSMLRDASEQTVVDSDPRRPMLQAMLADARTRLPGDHPVVQRLLLALGLLHTAMYNGKEGESNLQELLKIVQSIPPNQRIVPELLVRCYLIRPTGRADRIAEVVEQAQQVLAEADAESPAVAFEIRATAAPWLGSNLANLQRLDEAATVYRQSIDMMLALLGPDHPRVLLAQHEFGFLLIRMRRFEDAIVEFKNIQQTKLRNTHSYVSTTYATAYIAVLQSRLQRRDEALATMRLAIDAQNAKGDPTRITQEWWRAALWIAGGAEEPWASDALRRHVLWHMSRALRFSETTTFDFDEVIWSRFDWSMSKWNGRERVAVGHGDFTQLQSCPTPEPGVYWLEFEIPRDGRESIRAGGWLVVAPWRIEAVREFRELADDRWHDSIVTGPSEARTAEVMNFEDSLLDAMGPMQAVLCYRTVSDATIAAPAGRYQLHVEADDGVMVWLDGQLVIDAWAEPLRGGRTRTIALDFDDHSHSIRVQHFQYGQQSRLNVTLIPQETDAARD